MSVNDIKIIETNDEKPTLEKIMLVISNLQEEFTSLRQDVDKLIENNNRR